MNEDAIREFRISEKTLRDMNKGSLIGICFVELFIVFTSLYLSLFIFHTNIKQLLTVTCISMIIVGAILFVESYLFNRGFGKLKIFIYEDKIIRQRGRKQEILLWDNINKITIYKNHKDGLHSILIYFVNPQKNIGLGKLDGMEDLSNLIKERVSDKVIFQEKYLNKFQTNKILPPIIGLVPAIIMLFVIVPMGEKAFIISMSFFSFLVGLIVLIFRPFTKYDVMNKWVELIFGLFLFSGGILALVDFLS